MERGLVWLNEEEDFRIDLGSLQRIRLKHTGQLSLDIPPWLGTMTVSYGARPRVAE